MKDQNLETIKTNLEAMRSLDFDDLIILHLLGKTELTVTAIAISMGLSQPSISQRLRKIAKAFSLETSCLICREGRGIALTPKGKELSSRASAALKSLQGL